MARRHRCAARIGLSVQALEPRTLLSASLEQGPLAASLPSAVTGSEQETLNVQLRPGDGQAIAQIMPLLAAGGSTVMPTSVAGLYTVAGAGATIGALATRLAAEPVVQYAAGVQMEHDLTLPNDPDYVNGDEWQLNGTWGINVPGAWSVTTGSDLVIAADTDTGIAYNDPDIYDNVWINQAEIPSSVRPKLTDVYNDRVITFTDLNNPVNQGTGKITDSDGDGIITASDLLAATSAGGWVNPSAPSTQDGDTSHPNDLIGWNFVSNNNNPTDQNGHGTFTAGEIGAVGNNGIGVAGVNWNVQVMPVQFLDSSGSGTDTAAAAAIEYAVNHGAKVINASWGGNGTDSTIAGAIQYADQHGVIIVAAAGNNSADDDSTFFAPASYSAQYPNVIAVAAIGSNGALASFSNYGTGTVQLGAPGVSVFGTGLDGAYGSLSGTSMAAPLVTGTIALVEAAHPTWSMRQVIDAVLDTTTPDPALVGKVATGGIVNAAAAVANTVGPRVTAATPSGADTSSSGLATVELTFNEEINPATFTASDVTLRGPSGSIGGVSVAVVAGSNDHEFKISFPTQTAPGTYTLAVQPNLQDWYGNRMNQRGTGSNGAANDGFTDTIYLAAAGASDVLSVTTASTTTAGTAQNITVTALAPSGAVDTSYAGTIHFTSTDPSLAASLPANFTFAAGDRGTFTFTAGIRLVTAGPQSITVTDTAHPAIIGGAENIRVDPTSAVSLQVSGFPSPVVAGTAQSFRVTALDRYGNVATGYTGTIAISSSDVQASLPGNFSFTAGVRGTQSFSAVLKTPGTHSITAKDTATATISGTESVTVTAAVSAKFGGRDVTTQGNWKSTYGAQGYDVIGNTASIPSYAAVTPAGESSWTWAASTTDRRALKTAGGTGRIAACWYSATRFTVDVNVTDDLAHDLELYLLDWGGSTRVEQVTITNAATGAVLDTETVSSFNAGVYLKWTVSGNVLITITRTSGANAVLSGLFFDPPPASAAFIGQNTTTQGNWIGTFGSQGNDVIGSTAGIPNYATVTPSGESPFTWAASTTDPRALQIANGTGRIAACWFSATSFTVDVSMTDGLTHDLELYFLDWGGNTRGEQVTITNAATGAVLNTESVSSFNAGVYLEWAITGNVLITITRTSGANAVLSGLFFDPDAATK
jgi:subtilisin family serine protease